MLLRQEGVVQLPAWGLQHLRLLPNSSQCPRILLCVCCLVITHPLFCGVCADCRLVKKRWNMSCCVGFVLTAVT